MRYGQWVQRLIVVVALFLSPALAFGQSADPAKKDGADNASDKSDKSDKKDSDKPQSVTRTFSGTFNGERLSYVVTAGEMFLRNDKGENTASIYSVAYTKKDAGAPEKRPVTFIFNGGPGSSSIWLHIGVFGPKTIVFPEDATHMGAAPYKMADNPVSILDTTDMVFVDPVGTGYSRALGDTKNEEFWSLSGDAKSISSFIRQWLTEHGRWNSPKYLAGESYGTTRAAQIAAQLNDGFDGIYLNGVILISSVLDFHTIGGPGNNLPFISFLPTYAAVAWYHDKIAPKPDNLQNFLRDARVFAQNEYATALLKGSALTESERDAIAERLSYFSGLSKTYILRTNLRIDPSRFMKQLLRDRELVVGRFDGRNTGTDYDAAGESPDGDPALYTIDGAFVAVMNDYLTRTLDVKMKRRYRVLDGEVPGNWKWHDKAGPYSYVNVATGLGLAMRQNTDLRVLAANGIYDLATPFFATELTLGQNSIPRDRITLTYYEAGHMMYTHRPSRDGLARDVRTFIKAGAK